MFRLKIIGLMMLLSAGLLFAAAGDVHSFALTWQPDGFHEARRVEADRSEPFPQEPDLGEHEVLRGQFTTGYRDNQQDMAFAWDVTAGMLYVDLNRDGDLTNDPNGVLKTEDDSDGPYQHHTFPEFIAAFETEQGLHRYRIQAEGQNYPWYQNVNFTVQSGYAGNIDLYGQSWEFNVVDALRTYVGRGDCLFVKPASENESNGLQNTISDLPAPASLFLDGRCYDTEFAFKTGDGPSPALWCTLTERDVPTAVLRLEGERIGQLVLGDDEMLVLPRLSDAEMMVPVGDFTCRSLSLKVDDERTVSPQSTRDIHVSVQADSDNVLQAGAPLSHRVTIQRSGRVLNFGYELVGRGGERYSILDINDYENKPSVAIYKGDMQVGGGRFEYG